MLWRHVASACSIIPRQSERWRLVETSSTDSQDGRRGAALDGRRGAALDGQPGNIRERVHNHVCFPKECFPTGLVSTLIRFPLQCQCFFSLYSRTNDQKYCIVTFPSSKCIIRCYLKPVSTHILFIFQIHGRRGLRPSSCCEVRYLTSCCYYLKAV